jgi:superfamily II DNA or RNA helicase
VSQSRFFSDSQRAALYVAAEGHCTLCGVELQPGWHADHVYPHSAGGDTDVINGQALCPSCNLKKGATAPVQLREWQEVALQQFDTGEQDFLAVACPGAGKTAFALEAARRLLAIGAVERLVVVVPRSHLKRQWAVAATRFGLHLDNTFENGSSAIAHDYHGVAVTYHQVASNPHLYRLHADRAKTLVVFDEIHHAGDSENLVWGEAVRTAFNTPRCRRLLLSGTPFRSDKRPIPFVRYDNEGRCVPSYSYDYGQALADGVVRPIEFPAMNSEVRWMKASVVQSVHLADANDENLASALAAALRPEGDWVPSVLREAHERLSVMRAETPDAAGLVLASNGEDAKSYAAILERLCGQEPTVVLHEYEDSTKRIEDFAHNTKPWIVAVQMVSEGVDIPRLAVGVYATNYRTEMFFRQAVGRFVRRRDVDDDLSATLFIPSIEPLLRYASAIERTVDAVLVLDRAQRERAASGGEAPSIQTMLLSSSEAVHHSTIRSGEAFTEHELARAAQLLAQHGAPANMTAALMAKILRSADIAPPEISAAQPARRRTLADEKARRRADVKRLVGRLHGATGRDYGEIHQELNTRCGGKISSADLQQLDRRIEILGRWLGDQQ